MLKQISRVSSSHQNKKKKSYKHMSGNESILSLSDRSCCTINTLNLLYFAYNLCNTLKIHIPSFTIVDFLLFIKSQFTQSAQNDLHLNQCTPGHI
jgi:hypothetical protein